MFADHALSLAIWLPIVGGVAVLFTGGDANADLARRISLLVALAAFGATLPLYFGFDVHSAAMQFQEYRPWVEAFHINYHLGIDGISLLFILLTSFTTLLVVIAGWQVIQEPSSLRVLLVGLAPSATVELIRSGLETALTERFGNHRHVGDIRGRGLFWAIELVADRAIKTPFDPALKMNERVKQAAFERCLSGYPMGGTIDGKRGDHYIVAPPYIVTAAEIDTIVERLGDAVDKAVIGL